VPFGPQKVDKKEEKENVDDDKNIHEGKEGRKKWAVIFKK